MARYAAMLMAERYRKIPAVVRKALLEMPVSLLPTSELKRSRVRDAKRFFSAARLSRTGRYLRWMSTFDPDAKRDLYTSDFSASVVASDGEAILTRGSNELMGLVSWTRRFSPIR
jgi:hypothetical protein